MEERAGYIWVGISDEACLFVCLLLNIFCLSAASARWSFPSGVVVSTNQLRLVVISSGLAPEFICCWHLPSLGLGVLGLWICVLVFVEFIYLSFAGKKVVVCIGADEGSRVLQVFEIGAG